MDKTLARIASIIGPENLLRSEEDMAPFCLDWRKRYHGRPLAVACPGSTDEAARLVSFCHEKDIPVVPQGGNTGLVGGATPDSSGTELIVSLRRMNRLRQIDTANNTMIVEAGMTLADAQICAERVNRLFPLSLASEGTCQIGGALSTNAGGLCVLRYGTMRELTLGLEVVLAHGRVFCGLSGLRKDTSGFDVKQLFMGAEGTLGLITAASLKLFSRPAEIVTLFIGLNSPEEVIECLTKIRTSFSAYLSTFEMIGKNCLDLVDLHIPHARRPFVAPWTVLVELTHQGEISRFQEEVEDWFMTEIGHEVVIAQSTQDRKDLWLLRESISEAQAKDGISIKHDIGVPTSAIPQFLADAEKRLRHEFPECRIIVFGHVGDGNLHYNISWTRPGNIDLFEDEYRVNQIVYDLVYLYGGTLAAEHGIGQLKMDWLATYKDSVALSIMKSIKQALDPKNLMNPHKILR
ncbi:MAG: FAD-binding oxidoreductase [Proteobacteria bacterium]|nr:FAD-binding oxidoreductase [Pseudomonadota bacterium]MDE3208478.1 FAD-binding oxidoreductase [Pseudomonadota bacterium]